MELSLFKYNNTALAVKIIFLNYAEGNPKGPSSYPSAHKQNQIYLVTPGRCQSKSIFRPQGHHR